MSGASWKRRGKGGRLQGARAPPAAAEEEEWYTCRRHNRHAMGGKKVDGGCGCMCVWGGLQNPAKNATKTVLPAPWLHRLICLNKEKKVVVVVEGRVEGGGRC